jgi:hypothetical protein
LFTGAACFRGVSAFDAAWLVVAIGVEDQFADEVAGVAVDDTDVAVVDEDGDAVAAQSFA